MVLPHKFQDAEKFNLQFSDFSEISETADKLRWLRYQKCCLLYTSVASPNTPGMLALAAAGLFYYVFNYIVACAMERAERSLAYYQ